VTVSAPTRVRFGEFEADLLSGELFRSGSRVPIQEKPFRILGMLIRHAGELVTRKAIFEEVWADTYVQEDQSLNTAVRKVRLALGDSPDASHYIETVGSRGYRFLQSVQSATNAASGTLAPQATRLAVLPFHNLGPDLEEHLSDGVTEEMIARLGRLRPHFCVIAPSSVMRYKNTQKSVAEIVQELAADYCLTGSIRRSGERVRITTQLISGEDQSCIWSDVYDRQATDVFAIQNEVAEKVARSTMRLLASDGSAYVTNARAHEAYLRGRYFWNKRTGPALFKSVEFFEEAIRQDPDYALSYVGLADAYVMLTQHGAMAPREAFPKAKEAILRALDFDPALAEAYVPLAWVHCIWDRDFGAAEADLRKALQLNPSYAYAYNVYAFLMTAQGRLDESLGALKRALHLDPVAVPTNSMYASALYFARQYDAALDQCRECFELDPTFSINHAVCGQVLEQQGLLVDATNAFLRDHETAPSNPLAWAHLARIYSKRGMLQESDEFLNRLVAAANGRNVPGYFTGLVYAARGEYDRAFTWLGKAELERSTWILFLGIDPKADALRDDARYAELLSKLGLQSLRRPTSSITGQSSPATVLS
jgi:TolB-like protein/Tfp pilus assembly protein PilF